MTVPSATNKSGPYGGNGVTTVFAFGFRILDATHIQVVTTTAGVDTIVSPSAYSVSGVGNTGGGNVTFTTAPPTGTAVSLIRNAPFTQQVDLENQGAYYAETIEEAFDLAAMRDQQLQEQVDRSLKVAVGVGGDGVDLLTQSVLAVAAIDDDIVTVAGISGDVTAAVSNAADISTLAANMADVNTVAGNIADVNTVAGNIADVTAAVSNATDISTVAANVMDVTYLADVYYGPAASDPATRRDGSALASGDFYFNTVTDLIRVWDGGAWRSSVKAAGVSTYRYVATAAQTVFTGADAAGAVLYADAGALLVALNGVALIEGVDFTVTGGGNSVTLTTGATLSDDLVILSFDQLDFTDTILQMTTLRDATAGFAAQGGVPLPDRATFLAANIPAPVTRTSFFVGGQTYAVVRDIAGPIEQADGSRWRPDGDVTPQHFGAVVDGVADETVAVQRAFDYLNSLGGGKLYLPTGRYRKGGAVGSEWRMYPNTKIVGDGDASVIFFDDDAAVARSGNDLLKCDDTSNIAFENFKIEGTALTYLSETNQKQCLSGSRIVGLRVVNVTFEKLRYMATAFSNVDGGYFAGNSLDYIVRDGLRCTNSRNVIFKGNRFKRVADDAIAFHSLDAATGAAAGVVITDNVFEACQGIKVLGGKVVTIRGNIFRRTLRNPIDVNVPGSDTEGNTPQFAVDVSNNIITDTFGNRGTVFNIRVRQGLARSSGGLSTRPGVNSPPYEYNYLNNIDAGGVVVAQWGIRIANNTIARTLPTVAAYSDWGYGELFDRTTSGFVSDPAITDAAFQIHGVNLVGPASFAQIQGNSISGGGTGFNAIWLSIAGSSSAQDYAGVSIQHNTVFDWPGLGLTITTAASGAGSKQVVVQNNTFDLDPFFRASTHNADNTWSSTTGVIAINIANTVGILAGGNVFKNCGQTGLAGNVTTEAGPNIVYADFVANGDNASNKGVRQLPSAVANIIVPINGDPTSATFGQILNAVNVRATALITSGRYCAGHRLFNDVPALAGTAPNRYILTGWSRLTTGSGHVLNTDWAEMRTPIE